MEMTVPGPRIDWKTERDRIDLAAVATSLLGPAPGRRGERSRRLWWCCPFHQDGNPSFCVEPGKPWWRCYGCGAHGDAANLVMKLQGVTFPEAVRLLTTGAATSTGPTSKPAAKPTSRPPAEPTGLPEADALALVDVARERLWGPDGADALAYLTSRGLALETIRAARLGWTPGVSIPTRDGDRAFRALGWVIPWFVGPRLALVKIRQPDGQRPKYAEAYRDPAGLVCYPSASAIRPGRPLVVTEGELDALLLGQALGELASVVTLGSASARPESKALGPMLAAPRWFIATDRDDAGDRAADGWPARARRVRPPAPHKDWTEVATDGVDLRRWWSEILAGVERPPLFTWDELQAQRWGPATDGGEGAEDPSIDVELPDWRERVSRLPHERWLRWRRRSATLQAAFGRAPNVDEIAEADRQAALEVLAELDAMKLEGPRP